MAIDLRYTTKIALVYARQSTKRQVKENVGSAAHQADQCEHARRVGFPPEHIISLGDPGESGQSAVRRRDYQRAREMIRRGEVGGLFASEMSRLGRNAVETLGMIDDCRLHDVLIVLNGEINDPSNPTQLFSQQILAIVAEFENTQRRDRMSECRLANVRRGQAVSAPPTGYVAVGKGQWCFDPDERVQEFVRAVFRVYGETRSLAKTVRRLQALGIRAWVRRGAMVEPRKITAVSIQRMLHNPAYKGSYIYPQRKINHRAGLTRAGYVRTRRAEHEESIVIPDHHEAYVTPDEWEENLRTLLRNRPGPEKRSAGSGPALLQGLVRCGTHRLAMSTSYTRKRRHGTEGFIYQCIGEYLRGGSQCGPVTGLHLDRVVVAAVLDRLAPPELRSIQAAWERARSHALEDHRWRALALRRAEARGESARERLLSASPSQPYVSQAYAEEFEAAMCEVKSLRRLTEGAPSEVDRFTAEAWEDLLTLASDLPRIWNARSTDCRDRKDLLRTMVESVVIEDRVKHGRKTESLIVRINWADGHEATVVNLKLSPYAHQLIEHHARQGRTPGEIVRLLNAEGLITTHGNAWTDDTVRKALQSLRGQGRIT